MTVEFFHSDSMSTACAFVPAPTKDMVTLQILDRGGVCQEWDDLEDLRARHRNWWHGQRATELRHIEYHQLNVLLDAETEVQYRSDVQMLLSIEVTCGGCSFCGINARRGVL